MAEFFDQLAGLCVRELNAASKAADPDRLAGVIEGLATILGRTIARACLGDAKQIDTMLTGVEQHMTAEAAGMAGVMRLAEVAKARGEGG